MASGGGGGGGAGGARKKRRVEEAARPFRVGHCWISELKRVSAEVIDACRTKEQEAGGGGGEENRFPGVVAIMGVVVAAAAPSHVAEEEGEGGRNRPVLYHVDDGTGVIKVAHFPKRRHRRSAADRLGALRGAGASAPDVGEKPARQFSEMLRETERQWGVASSHHPVGACVEVKGRPQRFRGETEVLAFVVREVAAAEEEVERTLRLGRLRDRGIYPEWWFAKKREEDPKLDD